MEEGYRATWLPTTTLRLSSMPPPAGTSSDMDCVEQDRGVNGQRPSQAVVLPHVGAKLTPVANKTEGRKIIA